MTDNDFLLAGFALGICCTYIGTYIGTYVGKEIARRWLQ